MTEVIFYFLKIIEAHKLENFRMILKFTNIDLFGVEYTMGESFSSIAAQ